MNDQLKRLFDRATADKKKLGMMLGLLAVGLLLWGRLMLKQVPQVATATGGGAVAAAVQGGDATRAGRETVKLALPTPVERDLFALAADRYRAIPIETKSQPNLPKLDLGPSDESVRRAVLEDARGLRLQSVTLGDVPAAFINGRLVRLNATIDGFTLLHCDERSAVLEKHGTKVRIRM